MHRQFCRKRSSRECQEFEDYEWEFKGESTQVSCSLLRLSLGYCPLESTGNITATNGLESLEKRHPCGKTCSKHVVYFYFMEDDAVASRPVPSVPSGQSLSRERRNSTEVQTISFLTQDQDAVYSNSSCVLRSVFTA